MEKKVILSIIAAIISTVITLNVIIFICCWLGSHPFIWQWTGIKFHFNYISNEPPHNPIEWIFNIIWNSTRPIVFVITLLFYVNLINPQDKD